MTSTNFSRRANSSIIACTTLLVCVRSTASPPNAVVILPSGPRVQLSLTIHSMLRPMDWVTAIIRKPSRVLVCGTARHTHFLTAGTSPSKAQPAARNASAEGS